MNAKLKKVLTIIGAVAIGIVGVLLGRSLNRGRVHGVDRDIYELRQSTGRTEAAIRDATDELVESRRLAGEIAIRNRDAKADVKRAKAILARAKKRSNQVDDNGGVG